MASKKLVNRIKKSSPLRRTEHDDTDMKTACQTVLERVGLYVPDATIDTGITLTANEDRTVDKDPYEEIVSRNLERGGSDEYVLWSDSMTKFCPWHDWEFPARPSSIKGRDVQAVKEYFNENLGNIRRTELSKVPVTGYFGWHFT